MVDDILLFLSFSLLFNMFADLMYLHLSFATNELEECVCDGFRRTFDLNFLRRHSNCNYCSS